MMAAVFVTNNPDTADPFRDMNLRAGICPSCEQYHQCNRSEQMPVVSYVSAYIMKYVLEIEAGFTQYPEPGTWEDQPVWFLLLLETGRSALSRARNDKMKREQKRNGN